MLEYVNEQQEVLTDLGIWRYLTDNEIQTLKATTTEIEIDRLARTYRDKYWNKMLEDYENEGVVESDISEDVETADLPKAVKSVLLRNRILTSDDFLDIMMGKGWDTIRGLGESSVKVVLHWIFPGEDITQYVKKYKKIKEDK